MYREAIQGMRVRANCSMDEGIFCLGIRQFEWFLLGQYQGAELGEP